MAHANRRDHTVDPEQDTALVPGLVGSPHAKAETKVSIDVGIERGSVSLRQRARKSGTRDTIISTNLSPERARSLRDELDAALERIDG